MSNITKKMLTLASSGKTVFRTDDLAMLWNIEDKSVLRVTIARAIKNNYLAHLMRGVYCLSDKNVDVFELAGKMKRRSYISFETILAQSGIIFQWQDEIFSASDRSSTIRNSFGVFSYKKLPSEILTNNSGIINKGNYFIASPERALCDKIYRDGLSYFDDLSVLDKKKIFDLCKIYHNKRLQNDLKKLFQI